MKNLRTENLEVQYLYGASAVSEINLDINGGEKLVILGGENAGKTSLLKCLAGITPTAKGKILLGNKDITTLPSKKRNVLMLHEDLGLVPYYSLYKNFSRILSMRLILKNNRDFVIKNLATKYNLDAYLRDKASSLSPTNIIRAAFLRTELRESDLILIDNPFKQAMDLRAKLFAEMLPVMQSTKDTLIFATSSIDEAVSLDAPIIFMYFGKALQQGSYNKLKTQPAFLEVDKFFNTINYCLADIDKNQAELFGRMIALPTNNYSQNKIHITFSTSIDKDGFKTQFLSKIFKNNKYYINSTDGQNTFVTEVGEADFSAFSLLLPNSPTISINYDSIRFYDYKEEKAMPQFLT